MFQASDVPEGCTPEDIMEPDDATRNKCYTYLQELSNQLESAKNSMMSGGLGSVSESKYVRDKWSLAFKEFSVNLYSLSINLAYNFFSSWRITYKQATLILKSI